MKSSTKAVSTATFSKAHIAVLETDVALASFRLIVCGQVLYHQEDLQPGKYQVPTSWLEGFIETYSTVQLVVSHETGDDLFETGQVRFQTYPLNDGYHTSKPRQRFRGICVQNQYSTFVGPTNSLRFNLTVLRIDVQRDESTSCILRLKSASGGTIEFQSVAVKGATTFLFPDPINFSCIHDATLVVTGGEGPVHVTAQSLNAMCDDVPTMIFST